MSRQVGGKQGKKNMISCRKATEIISKAQDEALTSTEKITLLIHLSVCWCCRAFQKQLQAISFAARLLVDDERVFDPYSGEGHLSMSKDLKQRILQKIKDTE